MPSAHGTFKALGPVEWESVAQEDLAMLMTDIFGDAHRLIDLIPTPAANADLLSLPSRAAESPDHAKGLRKEWKEVKLNPRENPLGLSMYKLAAKDGKVGMEREFAERLKVQGQPGDGKIRGLGADKRVEDQTVDSLYQLSAQFPGPTTPRDPVTLCLSSDTTNGTGRSRSFMLVSRPCVHPDCPQRQGFIRGYYEPVEFVCEIKVGEAPDTTRSSVDATNESPSTASSSNSVDEKSATSTPLNND
ncbi:hypothetical protein F5B21DRAFT_498640 [Xylaria acuta]|nr:hypothetical protein F5B21DRAFT_498640 [Xylaria acuta]